MMAKYAIGLAEGGAAKAAAAGSGTAHGAPPAPATATAASTWLAYAVPILVLLAALYWQFGRGGG